MGLTSRNVWRSWPGAPARTRSFLAAEALNEYLDLNEWQVAGVKRAIASLDHGAGVAHHEVKDWVNSWGRKRERPVPKRSAT